MKPADYNPSAHEEPEPQTHHITIKAKVSLLPGDPAAVEIPALLEHLAQHPEQAEEVTSYRRLPRMWRPPPEPDRGPKWRDPSTGLTEDEDSPDHDPRATE